MTTPNPAGTMTPRTTRLIESVVGSRGVLGTSEFLEMCEHAQTLERELALANERLQEARSALVKCKEFTNKRTDEYIERMKAQNLSPQEAFYSEDYSYLNTQMAIDGALASISAMNQENK